MRALVFTGPMAVELIDVDDVQPEADEVVVSVARAGICGSELHGVREPGFRVPPLIMGHEFAGTTSDGSRVVVNPLLSCGQCDLCRVGRPQLCRQRALIGVHRSGGHAQRVAVPAAAIRGIPDTMTWEAAALVEPIANAVHAWALSGAQAGARVGVIGGGAIGLVCLQIARAYGAAHVAVAELSEERRALAASLGADDVTEALSGEFDAVFDAVGTKATHAGAIRSVRPGGTTVWLGLASTYAGFDSTDLVRFEKRVLGSFAYTYEEFDSAIDFAAAWGAAWVETVPLDAAEKTFRDLMEGAVMPAKALIAPGAA